MLTTATFIGWILRGPLGAVVATVGIFTPAFVFVALSGPLLPRIRRSPFAGAMLDGVNAASLALMTAVTWELGRTVLVSGWSIALALASVAILRFTRWNSAWLVAAGALVGALVGRAP